LSSKKSTSHSSYIQVTLVKSEPLIRIHRIHQMEMPAAANWEMANIQFI